MIPVKIQCDCGQRYAFDVEAVDGRMPHAVACPSCGIDGTVAANSFLTENAGAQPATVAAPIARVRLHTATPTAMATQEPEVVSVAMVTPRGGAGMGRQIDIIQITHEARAKMLWGDAPEEVVKFLMIQGVPYEEAAKLSGALFQERAATIRANGIGKVLTGIGMMCLPVVAWVIFRTIGFIPMKVFGIAIAIGVWGVYRVLKGTIMILAPKSEPGDVSEQ